MSEVTELTDEQAREMLRKYSAALQAYGVADAGSEAERIADEESDRLEAELLRRLSTQGAGPRPTCPNCQSPMEDAMKRFSANSQSAVRVFCEGKDLSHHQFEIHRLSDFTQFFRAPSDPPRPEIQQAKNELLERFAAVFERVGMLEMAAVIRTEIVD